MSAAANVLLPRLFGRYALFDFIGKGGMAEIYLARHRTELGPARRCVVKTILPELARDPAFSDMLVHEAKLAARLSHANVVQVLDLGREGERLFIAMEYVEGFDLNDLLRRCSRAKVPLPFELGVHVVCEALKGLDYAHRRTDDEGRPLGIVHRDVSPSNLLISFEGEVKVCDFGIARANDVLGPGGAGSAAHELGEALKGKAGYMSPEHARGEAIDARADVFAAGIVLWELAAGRRMYKTTEGRESLLDLARRANVPELPRNGLPGEDKLRSVIAKALTPKREERYPSAATMQRDLDGYAAAARLMTSPLALGEWLKKTFGEEILARRRARERATEALERGAPLVLEAIARPPSTRPPSTPAGGTVSAPEVRTLAAVPSEAHPQLAASTSDDLGPYAPRSRRRMMTIVFVVAALVAAIAAAVVAALMRQ
ncbi:MAG TPA: serine/threonine-protein kinase [Polyangiaceae bacterium]|nr:serine/threonine-protein kinase [Polyangiaceae bacterium]